MKWLKDKTGRFSRRPHYLTDELDFECETRISTFLRQRHGTVEYPISTDDITVLIEGLVTDLDLYADLAAEEGEVEGVTDFFPGHRPNVRISKSLTDDARMANRLRTTLTHELAHVEFHTFLFDGPTTSSLFDSGSYTISTKCNRGKMLEAPPTDWMEWQAAFASGAFLMPISALREVIKQFKKDRTLAVAKLALRSSDGVALINTVAERFHVSRDAARVRLMQRD